MTTAVLQLHTEVFIIPQFPFFIFKLGIEMGQGINTKVCQVISRELGVPMDLIRIKPTNNFTGANSSVTGGSMGSKCCCSVRIIYSLVSLTSYS